MVINPTSDGWRGIIADTFTFQNVEILVQAIANFLLNQEAPNQFVLLGYDRRFLSKSFAEHACAVLASNGLKILLSPDYVPTPVLSWNVKNLKCLGGLMISASHNPAQYNGIKLRETFGGPPLQRTLKYIEDQLQLLVHNDKWKRSLKSFSSLFKQGRIEYLDFKLPYINQMERILDLNTIAKANIKVFIDPMHGAGSNFISAVLRKADCQVVEINDDYNPAFSGLTPDPSVENQRQLIGLIKQDRSNKILLGLANDGDADRISAIDELGNFIDTNKIFTCLLWHYYKFVGIKGNVVKSIATSDMINRITDKFNATCIETPVGYKYISQKILGRNDIIMGGEESGGIGFTRHLYDKDGILAGLYLVEVAARRGIGLNDILTEIYNEIGYLYYGKASVKLTKTVQPNILAASIKRKRIQSILDQTIVRTIEMDGVKYYFQDGTWLLLRCSNTEPVIRIYTEGPTEDLVEPMLEEGKKLIKSLLSV